MIDTSVIASLIIIFILASLSYFFKTTKVKKSHAWRRKSSKNIALKISNMTDQQLFTYLRKIDPFTFEELVLDCFEKIENVKVTRNNRYTGDNGIDGTIHLHLNGHKIKYILQMKRYKAYINPKHLEDFKVQIRKQGACKGFFIHTGKTGKSSFNIEKDEKNLKIISGRKLINLLRYQQISLF